MIDVLEVFIRFIVVRAAEPVIVGRHPELRLRRQLVGGKLRDEIGEQFKCFGFIAGEVFGPGSIEFRVRPGVVIGVPGQPLPVKIARFFPGALLFVGARDGQLDLRQQL